MYIPQKLQKTAVNRWGDRGKKWLQELPTIVKKCEEEFEIITGKPFENAYCNFVVDAVTNNGKKVVLKLGFPESEIHTEQEALLAFSGRKSVNVLGRNKKYCAILLQRVTPGYDLTTITNDDEATSIAAEVMKELPAEVPSKHTLETTVELLNVIERIGPNHPLPNTMLEKARKIAQKLYQTKKTEKLLHGDMHHNNILYDEDEGWIAIDPQGVIGDPISEVGMYFLNPHGIAEDPNLEEKFLKRAEIFSEVLECDINRVFGWAFVQCVISCCWSVEDNEDGWKQTVKCVDVLEKLL